MVVPAPAESVMGKTWLWSTDAVVPPMFIDVVSEVLALLA